MGAMNDLLTPKDLEAVTGLQKKSAQRKLLLEWGIQFRTRNDDTIMTTWSAINLALEGPQRQRPNLKALRGGA
jgi:hypothetical protein